MTKKIDKEELKARCEGLINQTVTRNVEPFSNDRVFKVLKDAGKMDLVPLFKGPYRIKRGRGLIQVYTMYLKYLIEESLKYPIDIYIPRIGILSIKEIDSIGKRRNWQAEGIHKSRYDTPFNKSVMYRIYHFIFGLEHNNFRTPFRLNRYLIGPIVGKIYRKHPEGGYYTKTANVR